MMYIGGAIMHKNPVRAAVGFIIVVIGLLIIVLTPVRGRAEADDLDSNPEQIAS